VASLLRFHTFTVFWHHGCTCVSPSDSASLPGQPVCAMYTPWTGSWLVSWWATDVFVCLLLTLLLLPGLLPQTVGMLLLRGRPGLASPPAVRIRSDCTARPCHWRLSWYAWLFCPPPVLTLQRAEPSRRALLFLVRITDASRSPFFAVVVRRGLHHALYLAAHSPSPGTVVACQVSVAASRWPHPRRVVYGASVRACFSLPVWRRAAVSSRVGVDWVCAAHAARASLPKRPCGVLVLTASLFLSY